MNRICIALVTLSVVTLWLIRLAGAEISGPAEGVSQSFDTAAQPVNCMECHTNANPTKQNPCLAPCPRLTPKRGPDVVLLNQLSSQYVPVIFAHRLHAQMTEISGGCELCHHFNSAHRILACRECHSAANPESLAKPGLKGAYHRQCLNCHREWSHETECVVCHAKKTADSTRVMLPDPTDIMGVLHPNAKEPAIKIYQTRYEQGTLVTFRHEEHVKRYGFKCANCHREENCSRCHSNGNGSTSTKTLKEHHSPCALCHETSEEKTDCCKDCHADKEIPPFVHEQTGLELDDSHKDADCLDCHTSIRLTRYREPPTCSACHEEKEKISYPTRLPGKKVRS